MTNLGRIFILLVLSSHFVWGVFNVKVSATKIHQGDQLVVTFVSTQSDDFPKIRDIAGVTIESSSRSSSTSYINGKRSSEYTVRYIVTPMSSFTIPSYTMVEKGQKVDSQPIAIEVVKRTQNVDSELFFDVKASKEEVFIGEPFLVTLTYKQSKDLDVIDIRLTPPTGKDFWVDPKNVKEEKSQTSTHSITTLKYLFTAQKEGVLTIDPSNIQVGQRSYRRDAWGMLSLAPSYTSLFSDAISVRAKPLPKGAQTIGRFTFDVSADKTSSNSKDAVNVTVKIEGSGNFEDIAPFSLAIPNALVYDEKPQKEFALSEGEFKGSFTQKFAVVSDQSYTIEPMSFTYFDKAKKELVTLKSDPIVITINGSTVKEQKHPMKVERAPMEQTEALPTQIHEGFGYLEASGFLLIGALFGFLLRGIRLPQRKKRAVRQKVDINDKKALLQELLPFVEKNQKAKELVEALEATIYESKPFEYKRSKLKKLVEAIKKGAL